MFIFAAADRHCATHRQFQDAGCELVLGKASWETPLGDNEDEIAAREKDAEALGGNLDSQLAHRVEAGRGCRRHRRDDAPPVEEAARAW